jgi:hypothetical protein
MLALDIGIKHLAYCCADVHVDLSGANASTITKAPHIKHWALVNLQDLNDTAKPTCHLCTKPPKARAPEGLVCGRHLKKDAQIFDDPHRISHAHTLLAG